MELESVFRRLDLGRPAYKVYRTLLNSSQPLLAAHLATASKITRPQVYRGLEQLLPKGFVTKVVTGKRTRYRAGSPHLIEREFAKVMAAVSDMTGKQAAKREKDVPEYVRFFGGFNGIRAIFDDVITHTPKGQTFYRYTSERDLEAVNRYLSPVYRKLRDRKKLERLVISNPASAHQKKPRLERFIKYIEPKNELFDQDIIQLIYGNRLALINLNTEEGIIIENRLLADFQKVIFKQLYKKL